MKQTDDGEKYKFLSILDEEKERYEDHQELVTPPQSPINLTSPLSSSSRKSSSNGSPPSPPSPPRKMMSLDDLYEVTNPIDDDVTLYYHLATCDPIMFEEVIKDEKLRIAMDEEILSIEKNDMEIGF
jgi:hypothetical protein